MNIDLVGVLNTGIPFRPGVPTDTRATLTAFMGISLTLKVTVMLPSGTLVDLSQVGTELLWTVKKRPPFDFPFIKKVATLGAGFGEFSLDPHDTKYLTPGRYIYDVWLTTPDYGRNPVIPPSIFDLNPSVASVP